MSNLQDLKASLAARGLAPQKKFGQNFMLDGNFAAAIARDARPDEKTLLIEVGPGTGCLTQALLNSHPASRILAMELDRGLAELLRETFAAPIGAGRITLLEGDALESKHRIAPELIKAALEIGAQENRPRRVLCANLPYNAATPLLANMAIDEQGLEVSEAIATIQLELAERLLAGPGESAYGAVSAIIALRADGKILRRVGSEVFWPRPQVDSAVIRLRFKPWGESAAASLLTRAEAPGFAAFLQRVFSQRRKTLRGLLKAGEALEKLKLSPLARAEDLAAETLLSLFRVLA